MDSDKDLKALSAYLVFDIFLTLKPGWNSFFLQSISTPLGVVLCFDTSSAVKLYNQVKLKQKMFCRFALMTIIKEQFAM